MFLVTHVSSNHGRRYFHQPRPLTERAHSPRHAELKQRTFSDFFWHISMFYVLRKNRQRWEKIMPGIPSFSPGWQSVPGCLITWPLWHQGQGQLSAQSGPGPGSLTATHNGKTDSQWTPSSHWKLKMIQITWRVPTYVLMKSPLVLTKYSHYRYSPVLDRFCLLANWLTACTPHPYQRSSGLTRSLLSWNEGVLCHFLQAACIRGWCQDIQWIMPYIECGESF